MEPKRNRKGKQQAPFATSTPAGNLFNFSASTIGVTMAADSSFHEKENPAVVSKSAAVPKSATIYEHVLKAIEFTGTKKKGSSFPAIKKWVFDNREGDQDRLLVLIKKAMRKGLDSGVIDRAAATKSCNGLTGSFVLVKKESKKRLESDQEENPNRKIMKTGMPKASSKPVGKAAVASKVQKKPPKTTSKDKVTTKENEVNAAGPSRAKKPVTKALSNGALVKPNSKSDKKNAMSSLQNGVNPIKKTRKIKEGSSKTKQAAEANEKPAAKTNRKPAAKSDKTTTAKPEKATAAKANKQPAAKSDALNANSKMTRKLYTSKLTKKFRKDLSDSELNERTIHHRSMKSYSSDTEVDVAKKDKTVNIKAKQPIKKT